MKDEAKLRAEEERAAGGSRGLTLSNPLMLAVCLVTFKTHGKGLLLSHF